MKKQHNRQLHPLLSWLVIETHAWWWVASSIILLALLLRLPLLNGSFWLDEAAQALESLRPLSQQFQLAHDFQPPLFHLLIHFALYFGKSELWLRLIGAVLPGLITIFFLMLTLRQQSPRYKTISLLAGFLLATNSWHIFYSQELRPYALPAMFATISWYLILRLERYPRQQRKAKRIQLGLLALVTASGCYTSYLYPLLILSQLAYLVYLYWLKEESRRPIGQMIGAILVASATFLAWWPHLAQQLAVSHQLRQALPQWQTVVSIPQVKGLFLVFAKFTFGVLRVDVNLGWMSLSFWLAGLSLFLFWQAWRKKSWRRQITPFLFWLIIPIIAAWLISFFIPVLRPKRLLFALPALDALWAWLIIVGLNHRPRRSWRSWPAWALVLSLFLIQIYADGAYFSQPQLQREPWRQAIQRLVKRYPSGTLALFDYVNVYSPWRWYAPINYPVLTTGRLNINQVKHLSQRLQPVKHYSQVITFDYLTDLTDHQRKLNQALVQLGFEEKTVFQYPNIGFVRVYQHPKKIIN